MDDFVQYGIPQYTAARISVSERCDAKIDALYAGRQYVWGFETSSKDVMHYHIILHGLYGDTINKRWSRFEVSRAEKWSKANHKQNFLKGVSYTIKCGDTKVVGAEMEYWVNRAPAWVFPSKLSTKHSGAKYLTYRNGMKEIKLYRDENDLSSKPFREVLAHMFEHSGWRPDEYLAHRGIPREWNWEYDHSAPVFAQKLADVLLVRGEARYKPY